MSKKLSIHDKLTGEYIEGLKGPLEKKANSELETDEYVKFNDDQVSQVKGNTHEAGGEKMLLEDGTKILSDHLKVDQATKKYLKDNYDIKVSVKNTYAEVLEQYTKKLGLKSLVDQQSNLFKQLEKEKSNTKDPSTLTINTKFFNNKITDLEKEKEPLLEKRSRLFDYLFEKQEESKTEDSKTKEATEEGINSILFGSEQPEMEKGGELVDVVRKQDGTFETVVDEVKQDPTDRSIAAQRKRLLDFYDNLTFLGYEEPFNPADIQTQQDANKAAERFQKAVSEIAPNSTQAYAVYAKPTKKFIDFLQTNNPEVFERAGLEVRRNARQYSVEEAEKLKEEYLSSGGDETKLVSDGFVDGLFDFRRPQFREVKFTSQQEFDDFVESSSELDSIDGKSFYSTDKGDVFVTPILELPDPVIEPEPEQVEPDPDPTENITNLALNSVGRVFTGGILRPDSSILPPSPLQAHLKVKRRYDKLEPVNITDETQREDAFRSQDFVAEQLESLPDSQRRAVLAQTAANTQNSLNRATVQIAQANAQAKQQADQFNIGQTNAEENARAVDALDYERRQLTALAKTDREIREFYDYHRLQNAQDFKESTNLNIINQSNDNVNFDGAGISVDQQRAKEDFNSIMQKALRDLEFRKLRGQ